MKLSQKFLRIPVIMYDTLSLKHAMASEAHIEEQINMPLSSHAPIEYAVGHVWVKIEDIVDFSNTYTRDRTIEDVQENGFNAMEITFASNAPVICTLNEEEFIDLLDRHAAKLERYEAQQLEKEMQQVQAFQQQFTPRKNWFSRIFG